MAINGIKSESITPHSLEGMGNEKRPSRNALSDFKNALSDSIREMDRLLSQADLSAQEMVTGKKDIHQAMIDMEQAQISLRMMIQVRNKIISAYEEMMRIQF
jgi:flagellar hook-basal body complex protein FliE